jgi:hypothetical protein
MQVYAELPASLRLSWQLRVGRNSTPQYRIDLTGVVWFDASGIGHVLGADGIRRPGAIEQFPTPTFRIAKLTGKRT